jgi:hypothetical protein
VAEVAAVVPCSYPVRERSVSQTGTIASVDYDAEGGAAVFGREATP